MFQISDIENKRKPKCRFACPTQPDSGLPLRIRTAESGIPLPAHRTLRPPRSVLPIGVAPFPTTESARTLRPVAIRHAGPKRSGETGIGRRSRTAILIGDENILQKSLLCNANYI